MSEAAINNIVTLETEAERVEFFKKRMRQQLEDVCKTMDDASRIGLTIGFNLGLGVGSKNVITALTVARYL